MKRLGIGCRLSAIGHRPSAIGHRPSAIGYRLSAIGNRQSAIGNRPPAIGPRPSELGFSLLEVLIALLILAMSLTILLSSQSSSMAAASRSRDITIATLLARSKMVDIERKLVDEGFTSGEIEDDGDFGDEGFAKVKWKYKVSEVELDLSLLKGLCEGFGADKEASKGGGDTGACDRMTSALGAPLEQLATGIGQAMRLVDLVVTMPGTGPKGAGEKVEIRTLVTREDMNVQAGVTGLPGTNTGTGTGTGTGTNTGTNQLPGGLLK